MFEWMESEGTMGSVRAQRLCHARRINFAKYNRRCNCECQQTEFGRLNELLITELNYVGYLSSNNRHAPDIQAISGQLCHQALDSGSECNWSFLAWISTATSC